MAWMFLSASRWSLKWDFILPNVTQWKIKGDNGKCLKFVCKNLLSKIESYDVTHTHILIWKKLQFKKITIKVENLFLLSASDYELSFFL